MVHPPVSPGSMDAGRLAANYAKYRSFRLYNGGDKFLFSYISEWHPLLTPYMFVDKDTTVQADIFARTAFLPMAL